MELSQHIKERYAERMAGRDTKIDIKIYVAQNEEKIERDIEKLIEHSEVIFQGITTPGKDPVTVRLSGTWLIITDFSDRKGITLFKIELGLDEEFNKQYVEGWYEKLKADMAVLAEQKAKVKDEINGYKQSIKENEATIAEYEAGIRRLKKANALYSEMTEILNKKVYEAEFDVRRDIEMFTKKREF